MRLLVNLITFLNILMFHNLKIKEAFLDRHKLNNRQRPYHVGTTGSRSITKVKLRRAWLVLGWVTAWEHRVLLVSFFFILCILSIFINFYYFICCFIYYDFFSLNLIKKYTAQCDVI